MNTPAPIKIVLATFGTHGDLNPFIALAHGLRASGFAPLIASWPDFEAKVRAESLEFHAVRPSLAQIRADLGMDEQAMLRTAAADPTFLFKSVSFPYLRPAYEDMLGALDGAALVLTSTLAFAARLAAEKFSIPRMGVVLQPLLFLSAHDPGMNPHAPRFSAWLKRRGPLARRSAAWLVKAITASWARPVHAFRKELGLAAQTPHPIFDGQFSAVGTLALYSRVLGGVQPDHPPRTRITGFLFHDEDPAEAPETRAQLARFLDKGPPPIAFVLGSIAHVDAGDFFDTSLRVAKRLRRRAVIVTGTEPAETPHPGEDIFACRYVPYSQLFARSAAIVHQGGIGTTAQALRAGAPQIVVPFHGDQLDNGTRVAELGAGRVLPRAEFSERTLLGELDRLLGEPAFASAASDIAQTVRAEEGLGNALAAIREALAIAQGTSGTAAGLSSSRSI